MEDSNRDVSLILDEPQAVYYSGQLLSGRVECKLDVPVNIEAINITFLGQATVNWTEEETQGQANATSCEMTVHYMGREIYFNITQGLLGGTSPLQLASGTHNFPFQFQIPPNAPSSFISSSSFKGVGKVCYSVRAQILYNDSTRAADITKSFQVVAPLDLNTGSEDIKNPLALEFEEYYSCFCSSSPICVTVSLPQSGFCPGEDIPIMVTSKNDSSVEVKGMLFQLVQKECYHSMEPRSEWVPPETLIASVKGGPVLSNTTQETTRRLTVPHMIAPNLQNCSIIDVGYFLKVMIQLTGCDKDMEDETEICLGLVPLSTSERAEKYVHPLKHLLPQAPIPELGDMPQMAPVNAYQNSAMPNSGPNVPSPNATPYPGSHPYPGPAVSYPTPAMPYAGAKNINPASITHQGTALPYPNAAASYPKSTAPYPNPAAPYPNAAAPYPNSTAPYPNSTGPYPNSTAPYPTSTAPYPNAAAPYSNPTACYPSSAVPYPGSPMSVQGSFNPPYPPTESLPTTYLRTGTIGFTLPGAQPSGCPVANAPYPTVNRAQSPLPPHFGNSMPSAPSSDY